MNLGINDLYDDDDDVIVNQEENQEGSQEENQQNSFESSQENNNEENDLLLDILKSRGINDIDKIKFQDDAGNIEERSWNDLTREEQINIINDVQDDETSVNNNNNEFSNYELSDEESQLINLIRQSGATPQQYLESLINQNNNSEPTYKVDELSDDELFILDLESRVGELSDDELSQLLQEAKQRPELFQKQIEGIRKEYKTSEELKLQQEQALLEQENQEKYEQYANEVINAIDQFDSIGGFNLNLTDEDRNTLASFMLSSDSQTGDNYLTQALKDPELLTKAAWFLLNGEEALESITDYFSNQIKLASENQYKKGYQDGKNNKQIDPKVIVDKSNRNNNNFIKKNQEYKSINDLYDEE